MERSALSKEEYAKPREIAYYGGIRKGFEQAREGLEQVIEHCENLLAEDKGNIRLERYLFSLQKLFKNLHALQMKASRVKDKGKPKTQEQMRQRF